MNTTAQIKQIPMVVLLTLLGPILALSQTGTIPQATRTPIAKMEVVNRGKMKINVKGLSDDVKKSELDHQDLKNNSRLIDKKKLLESSGGTVVDGGGGNISKGTPISEQDIQNVLNDESTFRAIRLILNYASNYRGEVLLKRFARIENNSAEENKILERVNTKLFYNPQKTIFDLIGKTKIKSQNAPCFEPNSKEKRDGSSDLQSNSICISSDRLLAKLDSSNYDREIIILLIHEYSHLLGVTESEIKIMEKGLQEVLPQSPIKSYFELAGYQYRLQIEFSTILFQLEHLRVDRDHYQDICAVIYSAIQKTHQISDLWYLHYPANGMAFWNARDEQKVSVNEFRLYNLAQVCRLVPHNMIANLLESSTDDGERFRWLQTLFSSGVDKYDLKDEETRKELGRLEDWEPPQRGKSALLWNVSTGNIENIRAEIEEILNYGNDLTDNFRLIFRERIF